MGKKELIQMTVKQILEQLVIKKNSNLTNLIFCKKRKYRNLYENFERLYRVKKKISRYSTVYEMFSKRNLQKYCDKELLSKRKLIFRTVFFNKIFRKIYRSKTKTIFNIISISI